MKAFFFLLLLASTLLGHKLYILADDDGKTLHVKSYFSKSSACIDCEVKVYKDKKLLSSGKTDKKGVVNFTLKAKEVDIEVTASMGHKNKISYSSENEIITEDNNITTQKMFIALSIMALIFLLLRFFKR